MAKTSFGQSGANGTGGNSAPLMASYETAVNRLRLLPPNVASIERYGNIPINFSTGQINYSVPIHTIEVDKNFSIPIELTYNNTGLKPDEVPTWVGNGWDLQMGGTIVQTINGLDDFDGTAGLQIQANRDDLNAFLAGSMTLTQRFQYSDAVVKNFKDSQFDVFSFNLPGKSGKFYFDKNSDGSPKAVLYNQQPLRVSFANNQFIITDELGNSYQFTEVVEGNESYDTAPYYTDSDPYRLNSKTWYLTKITTAAGVEVTITYKSDVAYQLNVLNRSCRTDPAQSYGNYSCGAQSSLMTVNQKLITQINWKGKKLVFETVDRNDLYGANSSKAQALSRIKVYNETNELVRQIGFDYDNRNRLQLKGLSFMDKVTGDKVQNYTFDYFGDAGGISIPYLMGASSGSNNANNAIDHWGYYNGKQANTSKIPLANYSELTPYLSQPSDATADRSSDGSFSQYGMLKRITYPTGGYTEIVYEPNQVSYASTTTVPVFMRNQDVNGGYTLLAQDTNSDCSEDLTGTFTVASPLVGVRISWQLQGRSSQGSNMGASFQLVGPAGQTLVNDASSTYKMGTTRIDLPVGTYTYTLKINCGPQQRAVTAAAANNGIASFTAERPTLGIINLAVGGNRVSKVAEYDKSRGYNERIITYSQAKLLNEPYYLTSHQVPDPTALHSQVPNCSPYAQAAIVINERSVYNWDGFHILYQLVTESLGQGGINGKQVYNFDDVYNVAYLAYLHAPYPPAQNIPWRTGNLLSESSYRKNSDGTFEVVVKSSNTYTSANYNAPANGMKNGAKIERTLACPNGTSQNPDLNGFFTSANVPVFSDQFGFDTKTQEQWFSGNIVGQSTKYDYNPDWLVKQTSTTNSKGQSEKMLTYYANDFTNGAGANLSALKAKNAIGIPLKTIRTLDDKAVEGIVIATDALGNPTSLYRLEVASPVTLTHDPNTYIPNGFAQYESRQYSSQGNATQVSPRNGPTRTYVWANNHTYPVAEVINATQAQVEAVSGVGSLEGIAGLTNDNSIRAVGSLLRSGLTQSLITSSVMKSGVGTAQITNPSGINVSYTYDGLNRLATISNNDNDVIKEYTYNYRNATGTGSSGDGGSQPPYSSGSIIDQTATLNQAYSYTIPANLFTDPQGQALTYTLTGLPTGLSYTNGVINGTPSAGGQSLLTLTAINQAGLTSSLSFFLTVSTCLVADPYTVTGSFSSSTPVTFNAVNNIVTDTSQAVIVNSNASLILKAGQSVKLKTGFVIKPGATFRAYIGPCN